MVTLNINGKVEHVDVPADMPLLWALRDVVGLTGTKFGCGMALCGACTVQVDGSPIRSCVIPVSAAAGKKITSRSWDGCGRRRSGSPTAGGRACGSTPTRGWPRRAPPGPAEQVGARRSPGNRPRGRWVPFGGCGSEVRGVIP